MKLQLLKLKRTSLKHFLRLIFLLLILILFSPTTVWAQESELDPQKVIAIHGGEYWFSEDHDVIECTLEVWNVGASGGDAYAEAKYYCKVDGKFLPDAETIYGTFSGGPNGVGTVSGDDVTLDFEFINGEKVQITALYAGNEMIVQNPEAFIATPPSKDCEATISLPPNLKPGDDIWLSASYADLDGNSLASATIISEAWIINGKAGIMLTTWDGKAMKIELQYTCPGGQAHTSVYDLPASQEANLPASPPETAPEVAVPPEQPEQALPDNNITETTETTVSPLLPIVIVAGILAVGGGALLGVGAIIFIVLRTTGIIGGNPPKNYDT